MKTLLVHGFDGTDLSVTFVVPDRLTQEEAETIVRRKYFEARKDKYYRSHMTIDLLKRLWPIYEENLFVSLNRIERGYQ